MKTRLTAVAGKFYPGTKEEISQQLNNILLKEKPFIDLALGRKQIIGAIVPHAGYMYSAYQALHFFEILKHSQQQFDTFFIINPNHTGFGAEISLDDNDYWDSPYGKVEIDKDFYDFLDFSESADAHKFEHSGEVMLPLLQYSLNYPFKIVPITLSNQNPKNAQFIAQNIIKANNILKKKICIIASSDFSHFVEPSEGKVLDNFVIEEILCLNPKGVYQQVQDKNISVCGFGPIMSLMEYAIMPDIEAQVKILKIGNSGEVIPSNEVVDYVSILFYKE